MRQIVKYVCWLVASLGALPVAQAQEFAVSEIPDSLLKGANVVKRVDEHELRISSRSKASYRHRRVYTILNEKADGWAMSGESYDNRFLSIDRIEGYLYDAAGNKIKSLKKSDIRDLSGMGGGTEVSDDRIKEFGFYHRTYPYTVEFITETNFRGLMFLPTWRAIETELMSVQQTSFRIQHPADVEILYKAFNYPDAPQKTADGSSVVLTWQLQGLRARSAEPYAPPWFELTPSVFTAMKEFEMGGYAGSNASWEAFGQYVYSLIKGRDQLPPDLAAKVNELVAGKTDTYEKVAVLYKYLQENTRYISIQLGIGSWQPFDAAFVHTKKYGDCKALTNFMMAMLKHAGIPSIYSVIKSGSGITHLLSDFPSSQFNHVILCVPNHNDTIWLECTSNTLPAGYLGKFTCNRPALLVKETGSQLVRTPHYSSLQNMQVRRVNARLLPDGTLKCESKTIYSGLQFDDVHSMLHRLPRDKQKEVLQRSINLGTYEIVDFNYEEHPGRLPTVDEKLKIAALNYAQVTGKRLMLVPNVLSRYNWRLSKDSTRQFDIVFTYPFCDVDSVSIEVGEGYRTESLPKPVKLETEFGSYESSTELRGTTLHYYRRMQRQEGRYPASKWPELVQFFEDITKADRAKAVLVKATE
jgi:hypothetical protein